MGMKITSIGDYNVHIKESFEIKVKIETDINSDDVLKYIEYDLLPTNANIDVVFINNIKHISGNEYSLGYLYINKFKFTKKIIKPSDYKENTLTLAWYFNHEESKYSGFVSIKLNVKISNAYKNIKLPLYYRPFYTNAVLLLTPESVSNNIYDDGSAWYGDSNDTKPMYGYNEVKEVFTETDKGIASRFIEENNKIGLNLDNEISIEEKEYDIYSKFGSSVGSETDVKIMCSLKMELKSVELFGTKSCYGIKFKISDITIASKGYITKIGGEYIPEGGVINTQIAIRQNNNEIYTPSDGDIYTEVSLFNEIECNDDNESGGDIIETGVTTDKVISDIKLINTTNPWLKINVDKIKVSPLIVNSGLTTSDLTIKELTCSFSNDGDIPVPSSTKCYGKLFYSIANGCTIKEEKENVYKLNSVKLTYKGDSVGTMILKEPFRCYSEMESSETSSTKADSVDKISGYTKQMMYGITEPFTMVKENELLRNGIPVLNGEVKKIEYSFKNNTTINSTSSNINNVYSEGNILQVLSDSDSEALIFDTSIPMDIMLNIKEGYPEGYEDDASEINVGYTNVKFYDDIKISDDKYVTSGYSSNNVRYFALNYDKVNNVNAPEIILKSICDFGVSDKDGISPKVRYKGLNCNDYLGKATTGPTKGLWSVRDNGWRSINTYERRIGKDGPHGLLSGKTFGGNNGDFNNQDITDRLKSGDVALTPEKRKHVIGVYDGYTSLNNDNYEMEKYEMYSVIKPHTNRFSIIKLYYLE